MDIVVAQLSHHYVHNREVLTFSGYVTLSKGFITLSFICNLWIIMPRLFFYIYIYFGCVGSSLLCVGFL